MKPIIKAWDTVENWLSVIFFSFSLLLMFYEVLGRNILHSSIYWVEELVTFSMVWSMFWGASIIVRNKKHVAVKVFVNMLSEENQNILNRAVNIIALCFSIILLYSGIRLVGEIFVAGNVSESRLNLPMWITYLIMPIGGVFLSFSWIFRLFNDPIVKGWHKKKFTYIMILVIIAIFLLIFNAPSPLVALATGLLAFLVMGIPVSFAMGMIGCLVILAFDLSVTSAISQKLFWSMSKYTLLAIPFFIMVGNILSKSVMGVHLLELMSMMLKRRNAGVGIAVMVVSMIFAAMSGSSVANAAALGLLCIPLMEKHGYPRDFAAGVLGTGGTLAVLIPPSINLVLFGAVAGTSITSLFKAGILPGVLLGIILCIYIYIAARKKGYDQRDRNAVIIWSDVGGKFVKSVWALLMPIIILGSIYAGIATPTEAAAVSIMYALIACFFIYKDIKPSNLYEMIKESVHMSASIYFIVMASGLFGFIITKEQLPQMAMEFVVNSNMGPALFLVLLNIILLICGCFLGAASIIVMIAPIVAPIALRLGIDPVHLGIIFTINLEIGFLTPPVGTNLYVLTAVADLPFEKVVKACMPFVLLLLVGLIIITYVPGISLLFV
ncbi:MAG: TRAP transporter large permease subunit [Clostridiales Family XIII bacterium]|jgi:C4-dicarboxylate transporter DctM subunit|nr:TRAP transporter large permease subunit [Clostridiales Family XIII bacterium]